MSIKHHAGRWPEVAQLLSEYHATLMAYGCNELAFRGEVTLVAGMLPPLHKDPFDRGLIARATKHQLALVTQDELIRSYVGAVEGFFVR